MAAFISPPGANDDCRTLWRKVDECIKVLNALANMTARIEGREVRMIGKLQMGTASSELHIHESTGISN